MSDRMKDMRGDVLFLRPDVLREDLNAVLRLELADETGIPQFAGDTEVLAAAHERVALACLSRGGDAIGVKVLLLSSGNANKSAIQSLINTNTSATSDAEDVHSPAQAN